MDTLHSRDAVTADDDVQVDPTIVILFAIFGLIFDFISLYAFVKNQKKKAQGLDAQGLGVNMTSAFLHLGADFLRSTTTFIEGLVIVFAKMDSDVVDAYACLIVSGTILVGVLVALIEWFKDLLAYCRGGLGD